MLTSARLQAIFEDPFPSLVTCRDRLVLYRRFGAPPMVIGQADDISLLATYDGSPELQRDIWIGLMRRRWPDHVEPAEVVLLEQLIEASASAL